MDDLFNFGKGILGEQPFSQLMGAELIELSPGKAVLQVPIKREFLQQHGFVHGGVVSYLADNALTFAGGSLLGDSVTTEFKINYMRPAIGETLTATAVVEHSAKSQAVVRCDVVANNNGKEKVVAVAQGTITKLVQRT